MKFKYINAEYDADQIFSMADRLAEMQGCEYCSKTCETECAIGVAIDCMVELGYLIVDEII